ncbi:hypothetical protein T484DRAFT_1910516 [Baffinella frigidus]|nr:hypothetical protein T484DRAFT_1910516 [Cryptophyta sp. CCMP2293]
MASTNKSVEEVGASGSAGAGPPVALKIDPALIKWVNLDVKENCICAVCAGVMIQPTIGCYDEIRKKTECPTCRRPVADEEKLLRNRSLEGIVSKLEMRCQHGTEEKGSEAADAGAPPAKKAKKEGKKSAACGWVGTVGGLPAHLGECGWVPVKCANAGCSETPLRKDMGGHNGASRCRHCRRDVGCRALAAHEGRCPSAKVACPNACGAEHARASMNVHRAACANEALACRFPGCGVRLPRGGLDAHVAADHPPSAALEASLLSRIAALEERVGAAESEQRLAAAALPTSWVFNWRADGWGMGKFVSETHDFGEGVTGWCVLQVSKEPEHSHLIAYRIQGRAKCRAHVAFSVLDKRDRVLRTVFEIGSAAAPREQDFSGLHSKAKGMSFSLSAEEKAQSLRADGSVRVRAAVRLFLDGAP